LHPGCPGRRQPGRPGVRRRSAVAGEEMTRAAVLFLTLLVCFAQAQEQKTEERISFSRDIRPLLSQYCFACHGPDRKNPESDLRLDTRDGALAAIVPGHAAKSELIRRITT